MSNAFRQREVDIIHWIMIAVTKLKMMMMVMLMMMLMMMMVMMLMISTWQKYSPASDFSTSLMTRLPVSVCRILLEEAGSSSSPFFTQDVTGSGNALTT